MVGREPRLAEATAGPAPLAGARYLRYLAGVVVLLGLFERSDLLSLQGVALLVAAMVVVTVVGLAAGIVQVDSGRLSFDPRHYLIPVMAVVAGAAVSIQIIDWKLHVAGQLLVGVAVFASSYVTVERLGGRRRPGHEFLENASVILVLLGAYLALLAGVSSLGLRVLLIFVATYVAAYVQLSRAVSEPGRALVGGMLVSLAATAIAFGLISAQFLDISRLGSILLVAWYVNTGMVFYMMEGSMTRQILVEYLVGVVICAGLVATAILTH
jgi:flagellar biosynthesis protein FliQ